MGVGGIDPKAAELALQSLLVTGGFDLIVALVVILPSEANGWWNDLESSPEASAPGYARAPAGAWTVTRGPVYAEATNDDDIVFPVLGGPLNGVVGWVLADSLEDGPTMFVGAIVVEGAPVTVNFGTGEQPRFPAGSLKIRLGLGLE